MQGTKLSRRYIVSLLKYMNEIADIASATQKCYFLHGQKSIPEKVLCSLHA
jgi:hypothetical protein